MNSRPVFTVVEQSVPEFSLNFFPITLKFGLAEQPRVALSQELQLLDGRLPIGQVEVKICSGQQCPSVNLRPSRSFSEKISNNKLGLGRLSE